MRTERRILRDLYKTKRGLFSYTFYTKYRIEPEDTASFIKKFEEKEWITYTEGRLFLSKKGREIIYKKEFSFKESRDRFSDIPDEHKAHQVALNEPYIPDAKKVPPIRPLIRN